MCAHARALAQPVDDSMEIPLGPVKIRDTTAANAGGLWKMKTRALASH